MMRRRIAALFVIASAGLSGQANFTSSTQLVIETVVVKDKQGRPVEGLRAEDFHVTENGAPQQIKFFDYQRLTTGAPPVPAEPEHIHIYDTLGRVQISSEAPGSSRYQNRRLLALYFDMTAMPPVDQLRALRAAEKFVRARMTAADLVAILRY